MTTDTPSRPATPRAMAGTLGHTPLVRLGTDELAVVEPAPAKRWLGVVNAPPWRGHGLELIVTVALGTIALGTWGFSRLSIKPSQGFLQDIYNALKLYTFDLGPASGGYYPALHAEHGLVHSANPNWQIVVAFALAISLVARAVIALLAGHGRRYATRHWLSGHVIVCGAGVHGTALARQHQQAHNVVLIDLDPQAPGMKSHPHRNEWRLVADAVQRETLETAGVARASRVIAVTGNDFVNSQIVTAILALAEHDKGALDRPGRKTSLGSLQVLVQVENPSLARFLEEGEHEQDQRPGASTSDGGRAHRKHGSSPTTSVFAANAVAAGALFGEGSTAQGRAVEPGTATTASAATGLDSAPIPLAAVESAREPHLLLAGDHPLLDAIALAALRRRRARWQLESLAGSEADLPALRVSLLGPDASARVEWLTERWLPESDVLELEGEDIALGDVQGLPIDWLRTRRMPDHAIVACNEELDGIGLALVVSRALGPAADVKVTRVAAQPASELDHHLSRHTERSPHLATTRVRSIDELAWQHNPVEHVSTPQRLLRCVRAEGVDASSAHRQAQALLAGLDVHADPAPRVTPGSEPLVRAMLRAVAPLEKESVTLSAMIAAGLALDLDSPRNLLLAARQLDQGGDDAGSLSAWCEFIRRVGARSSETGPSREVLGGLPGPGMQVKVLRDAAVASGARPKPARRPGGLPAGGLIDLDDAEQVVIFAGGGGLVSAETCRALETMLEERALLCFDGLLVVSEAANGLAAAVQRAAERAGTAESLPASVRAAARGHRARVLGWPAARGAVKMWAAILAAGVPVDHVYVIGVPGAEEPPDELVLARALGARIAWVDPADEMLRPLDDLLPLGADEVLELPADGMTLRAFLTFPGKPRLPRTVTEEIAQDIHRNYRDKDSGRKDPDDPALARWDRLLPSLQDSNIAQADDLPNKLALVGKQPVEGGARLRLEPDEVELLAEVEHGRWNHERLTRGWRFGHRHVTRLETPHLRPWKDLSDESRSYDREAVRSIDTLLQGVGYGVAEE